MEGCAGGRRRHSRWLRLRGCRDCGTVRRSGCRERSHPLAPAHNTGSRPLARLSCLPALLSSPSRSTFPELNTEFDVYRVGTLLELVREVATVMAGDSRSVKVCVQQPLGQGVFAVSGGMRGVAAGAGG